MDMHICMYVYAYVCVRLCIYELCMKLVYDSRRCTHRMKGPVISLKYDSRLIYFYMRKNALMDHVLLFIFHSFYFLIVTTGRN
jgi:hypothetical protein